MIIQCEKCLTKFNLDDALIDEKGTKVKCSVCANTFVIFPEKQDLIHGNEELEEKDKEEKFWDDEEGTQDDFGEEPEEPLEEASFKPEKKRTWKAGHRLPVLFLSIILILVIFGVLMHFMVPDLLPRFLPFLKTEQVKETEDIGISRLTFHSVSGAFVDSNKEGSLFIIKGKAKNGYPNNRIFLLMRGSILDHKGKTVKTQTAYAGNVLKEEDLKTLSLDEIGKALKSRTKLERGNYSVAKGDSIPFMIVLGNLPEDVSEFTVEAIRSSPDI